MHTPSESPDNVLINKAAIIERSLKRMRAEYQADPELTNYTHIDAMILNIERACQAAIDAAQHLVALHRLGIPQNSAESFLLLENAALVSPETVRNMVAMTGFRNIAIHEYQSLDMSVLQAIVTDRYRSLLQFCREVGVRVEVPD